MSIWTKARTSRLITLYNDGKEMKQIAKSLRLPSKNPIGLIGNKLHDLRQAKKVGRRRVYQYWTDKELKRLREMRKAKLTRADMAKKLNRNSEQINGMLARI